jgi:hypothetical protein
MCTLCDSTNINTIIEFVPHVSGDGFSGGSDSYLQFRDTHAPCLLKLCIPPSNGIARWWLFPEFSAELSLDNCTQTIILNNPALNGTYVSFFPVKIVLCVRVRIMFAGLALSFLPRRHSKPTVQQNGKMQTNL